MALIAGSPAIDAADQAFCPGTDQRGEARPAGAGCDLGAFEGSVPAPGGNGGTPSGIKGGIARSGTGAKAFTVKGFAVATRRATVSSRGVVSLRVRCPAAAVGTCRGRLTLTARGSKLGRAAFSVRAGRARTVRLRLSRTGHRLLRKRRKLRAVLAHSVKDSAGARSATGRGRLTLRVAKAKKRRR